MAAIVHGEKCTACGICEDACPQEAMTVGDMARLRNNPAEWPGGSAGDQVIVLSYCELPDEEARAHQPRVVLVDEKNKRRTGH